MLKVTQVKYLKDYTIWVHLDDGTEGAVDLSSHLDGPVFEPLKDVNLFKQAQLDEEISTVSWPNGADFAPEFLKQHIIN